MNYIIRVQLEYTIICDLGIHVHVLNFNTEKYFLFSCTLVCLTEFNTICTIIYVYLFAQLYNYNHVNINATQII